MHLPRRTLLAVFLAVMAAPLAAQHDGHAAPDSAPPLYGAALGPFTWSITTSSPRAQAYFDQGVKLMYAYARAHARPSFAEARRLDPGCAMCWWGEAWSMGAYLNGAMSDADAPAADAAARRARDLGANGPPLERALTEAMTARYAPSHPAGGRRGLDSAYVRAMEAVYARFPDDLQVATLYADAMMLLEPRRGLWSLDKPSVARIHQVLERGLAADISHSGVCHAYIHATETTPRAGEAQRCADLLVTAMPGASHLNHMPSHTYNRVGRWEDAVNSNVVAVESDRRALADSAQAVSIYAAHNLHMLLYAAAVDGQEARAMEAADAFAALGRTADATSHAALVRIRFGRWNDALALTGEPANPIHRGLVTFARGYAHLRLGARDSAAVLLARVDSLAANAPAGVVVRGHSAASLLGIVGGLLRGEMARAEGRMDDAVAAFQAAVALEDALQYDEPEPLPFAARDWLGAALLESGRAADAERVYRAALEDRPHNGWSIFGLEQALRAQGRTAEADAMKARFDTAWTRSRTTLQSTRF
jgi:tetratricopeptide (TPR) repeat protein